MFPISGKRRDMDQLTGNLAATIDIGIQRKRIDALRETMSGKLEQQNMEKKLVIRNDYG